MSIDAPVQPPDAEAPAAEVEQPAPPAPEPAATPPARETRAPRGRVSTGNRKPRRPIGLFEVVFYPLRLLQRILFPKLVDRYVMGELFSMFAFGWALFIILFVVAVNTFRLVQMLSAGAPLDAIMEMLALRVVLASVYCLPMSMLLAGLMTFGRLSGDSELIAMQAGGIRNLRIVRNAFILGLALSFVGLGLNEYVIPPAGERLHQLTDQVKAQLAGKIAADLTEDRAFVVQDFEGKNLSRVVVARKFEPAEGGRPAMMRGVTYMQYDEEGKAVQLIVEADRAEYVGPQKGSVDKTLWRFHDARTQMMGTFTGGQRWLVDHEQMELTLNKTPDKVVREQKDALQMTYRELKQYIQDLKETASKRRRPRAKEQKVIRELEVELENKLAVPFASVVLAMIGAPLGIRKQRSTAGVGIGLSLIIIIAYYLGMSFLGVLGINGQVEPVVAAWGCNIAGLLVGLFLTLRSS